MPGEGKYLVPGHQPKERKRVQLGLGLNDPQTQVLFSFFLFHPLSNYLKVTFILFPVAKRMHAQRESFENAQTNEPSKQTPPSPRPLVVPPRQDEAGRLVRFFSVFSLWVSVRTHVWNGDMESRCPLSLLPSFPHVAVSVSSSHISTRASVPGALTLPSKRVLFCPNSVSFVSVTCLLPGDPTSFPAH